MNVLLYYNGSIKRKLNKVCSRKIKSLLLKSSSKNKLLILLIILSHMNIMCVVIYIIKK